MALIVCPKHGCGIKFACRHVCEAVRVGQPCPDIEYRLYHGVIDPDLEVLSRGIWLCPQCIADYELPPSGTIITDLDAFMNNSLQQALCPSCFDEWQRLAPQTSRRSRGFLDAGDFPFAAALESRWEAIREEYLALPGDAFDPWVQGQMHGGGWSVFGLVALGQPIAAACAHCPNTAAALEQVPGLSMAGFSRLAAYSHVQPHVGWAASVYRLHLGLVVPPGCRLRVADETRPWQAGRSLIFDDTIEHEAWNDSNLPRGVLLLDFMRPGIEGSVADHVPDEVRQYADHLMRTAATPRKALA